MTDQELEERKRLEEKYVQDHKESIRKSNAGLFLLGVVLLSVFILFVGYVIFRLISAK